MTEVQRTLNVLKNMGVHNEKKRNSALGMFLARKGDHRSFKSFDVYFNRAQEEQIDLQVGSYTFNMNEWSNALPKLAELLVLKGAQVEDLERLQQEVASSTP